MAQQLLSLSRKIRRRITKLRLQPIRVFCLHHVCEQINPITCCDGDWLSIESFKHSIDSLIKDNYRFLSLKACQQKLANNLFRFRKYAVLTFDDGYRSSLPTYRWLEENNIPYTLFVNAKYFDGASVSGHIVQHAHSVSPNIETYQIVKDLYLNETDLAGLSKNLFSVGSHGFEHIDATTLTEEEFKEQILRNIEQLNSYQSIDIIPFHAYTWGRHSASTDKTLHDMGIIPVLMDCGKNYDDASCIHREEFPKL